VASLGQPVLRRKAELVDPKQIRDKLFQAFLDDLLQSMLFHDGVGLAAPQVFRSQRVVAVWVPPEMDEQGTGIEPSVFINPELLHLSDDMVEGWEGCLSLKDLRGIVPRHQSVTLQALDQKGQKISRKLSGFPARVLQHEVDHLDGIVFVDRMRDMSSLGFEKDINSGDTDDP
jgi:peptide deformylase